MTIEKCGERKWSVSSYFAVHSFSFAVFLWIVEMGCFPALQFFYFVIAENNIA